LLSVFVHCHLTLSQIFVIKQLVKKYLCVNVTVSDIIVATEVFIANVTDLQ